MSDTLQKLRTKLNEISPAIREVKAAESGPAPGGRLASPSRERTRRIYVGLDFGTCSCKAVVQVDPEEPQRRRFLAVSHAGATAGANDLLYPSAIDYRDGGFRFGYAAETAGAAPVRSFKMCLPCLWPYHHAAASACPRCGTAGSKAGQHLFDGQLWSVEDLSILFLANVLKGVKGSYLNGDPAQFFINSAAPLDQMPRDSELGRSFQRVLYYAHKLSDHAKNPWPALDALEYLNKAKADRLPDLDLASCPTTVFPETHAAMTSVLSERLQVNMNFGTVDVGAGTTDVALFYFHRSGGAPEACYYTAKSEFIGMDQIDDAIRPLVPEGVNVRGWRERQSAQQLSSMVERLSFPIEVMWKHFRGRLGESYKRNPGPGYWSDLTLFLIGGGARLPSLVQRFARPFAWITGDRTVYVERPDVPTSLNILNADGSTAPLAARDATSLLLLAYGLSHGAATIAQWVRDYSFYREHLVGNGGLVAEVPYSDI